jgi:hypothetical protein
MSSSESKIEKIQNSYQQLSAEAHSLNAVSDEFTKAVGVLDEAIKKLNVGLTVWVNFSSWKEGPDYSADQIGYAKVNGTWGIALRSIAGSDFMERDEITGPWLFKDAPREFRLEAVEHIPKLIEALAKSAAQTREKLKAKTIEAQELAAAIGRQNPPGPPGRLAQAFKKAGEDRGAK